MTTAFEQKPFLHSASNGAAKIHARDRTTGARTSTARLQSDRKCRAAVALFQARRDQAHNTRMPAFCRGDDHGTLLLEAKRGERFRFGLRECHLLNLLAFPI